MADALTNLAVTTELEAVNTMLRAVGDAPISDIEEPGLLNAVNAKETLRRVSRSVQLEKWNFNTEYDYPLSVNGDGKIPLGSDMLSVDTYGVDNNRDVTRRGGFLYDKDNHTFTFTAAVKAKVTFFLSFEDIPESARNYITILAAMEHQSNDIGQDATFKFGFDRSDELRARVILEEDDGDEGDHNVLTDNLDTFMILDRNVRGGSIL